MRFILSLVFLVGLSFNAFAQGYKGGLQVEVKPSFQFKKDWKLSTKFSSRTYFFSGGDGEKFHGISDYNRTELELIASKKISSKFSLGAGYLIRNQKESFKHRFIQQLERSTKVSDISLGHRFRLDETFQKNKEGLYRFRYRFSFKKPFVSSTGEKKSTYWYFTNEYISNHQKQEDYSMEIRFAPGIGLEINENNKLELGIDYRMEELLTTDRMQLFLFNIAWIPKF